MRGWGALMSEVEVKINSERIDDIPLIVEWLKRIEIAKHIDQKMKKPHGNHQGMSYGQLSVLLLGLQVIARQEIEIKLGRQIIRAYELPTQIARTDTTNFSVNQGVQSDIEETLLRHGYSKDKRPDLRQYPPDSVITILCRLAHSNQAITPDLACADSGFLPSLQAATNTFPQYLRAMPQKAQTSKTAKKSVLLDSHDG